MNSKKLKKFFLSFWPFLLIILVFFLRIPSLFEPFTYADEGIYLTLGQALRRGLVLYRDIYDNKPPLIYLLASFAGNFFNYRLILFLWSLATIFVFYRLAQFLFAKNRFSVLLSTSVFAILTSLPTFEGNIANAENFMLLPTIAGFYLILKFLGQAKTKSKFPFTWFLAGILFCLAVLFKVPAIFDFLAALLVCLLFINQKNLKAILAHLFSLLVGFLLPLMITFFYFGLKNSLMSYLQAAFFQNLLYLSSWGNQVGKVSSLPIGLLVRGGLLLLIILLLFLSRQKISLPFKTIILWFFTSLFAALLSARPYPHYLLQVLPAFALSFGLLSLPKTKIWLKPLPSYFTLILIWVFVSFHFWYYPNFAYFKNFYQFAFKIKSHQKYLNYFDRQASSLYQTAAFLRSHSEPQEKIFIWGVKPSIYALTHRLPVDRYTVSYHIIDLHSYEETISNLKQSPPRWLVWAQDEKASFPQLQDFIENNYVPFQQIGNLEIFYRLPKISRL
jgi:hypothetical protein